MNYCSLQFISDFHLDLNYEIFSIIDVFCKGFFFLLLNVLTWSNIDES